MTLDEYERMRRREENPELYDCLEAAMREFFQATKARSPSEALPEALPTPHQVFEAVGIGGATVGYYAGIRNLTLAAATPLGGEAVLITLGTITVAKVGRAAINAIQRHEEARQRYKAKRKECQEKFGKK